MGLIRDIVGSAINNGASGVNNGFSGKNKSGLISSLRDQAVSYTTSGSWSQAPVPRQYGSGYSSRPQRSKSLSDPSRFRNQQPFGDDVYYQREEIDSSRPRESIAASRLTPRSSMHRSGNDFSPELPPAYTPSSGVSQTCYYDEQPARGTYTHMNTRLNGQSLQVDGFRPLILPQIAYGDGQPFLRGYSAELCRYNISLESFVQVVDRINVAILPSPENQLFQKGANIAGFFLPGASGIALTVGQVALGLGAAAGHSSKVSSALSEANTNIFFPLGLELCIGTSADVDSMVGIYTGTAQATAGAILTEERLEYYNGLVAPLSSILPPERQGGRQDPIALLGNQISRRNDEKKVRKAEKKLQKGEGKQLGKLETGLKWLILRQAR